MASAAISPNVEEQQVPTASLDSPIWRPYRRVYGDS